MAAETEAATAAPQAAKSPTNRRKFLTGAAATAAGATAAIAAPNISRAQTATLKMQGAWAQQDILNEFAEDYVTRVNEMGGDRLKIDYLISGSVVKPFSVYDAVHPGVLQGGHTVPRLRLRQEQGGLAVRHRTLLRLGRQPGDRLDLLRGGADLHRELMQDILGFNIVSSSHADAAAAARLVQERDQVADDSRA